MASIGIFTVLDYDARMEKGGTDRPEKGGELPSLTMKVRGTSRQIIERCIPHRKQIVDVDEDLNLLH